MEDAKGIFIRHLVGAFKRGGEGETIPLMWGRRKIKKNIVTWGKKSPTRSLFCGEKIQLHANYRGRKGARASRGGGV